MGRIGVCVGAILTLGLMFETPVAVNGLQYCMCELVNVYKGLINFVSVRESHTEIEATIVLFRMISTAVSLKSSTCI